MSRPKKTSVVADVKGTDEEAVKAVLSAPTKHKPFIEVIEEPVATRNVLEVMNKNPMYAYQWNPKREMANSRHGHWLTLNKTHPDFKGVRVHIDHTPNESFISFEDLILCVTRKETFNKWFKAENEKGRHGEASITKEFKNQIEEERSKLDRKKDLKIL